MSFFYDFLKYFDISDINTKTTITTIVGYGIIVIGKIKINDIIDDCISLVCGKEKINIYGSCLKIKSISKGEIVISGNVNKVETGE
ncbi:MAG: YabP/YqfC family sporulation protein [Clostridia bacterium]|nr:YabP/YqfC family sporulation protein [Clostridia bacterium]